MPEIPPTYPDTLAGKEAEIKWPGLESGDTGEPQDMAEFNDNTVTVTGDFNSETVTMLGSNDEDGGNPFPLTDNNGIFIALTEAGGRLIAEAPKFIFPSISGASGGDVDVIVKARKI